MKQSNGTNPKKLIGLVATTILAVAALIMGIRVAGLVQLTREEAGRTPTPSPRIGNIMAVTIDPNAPTPAPVIRHGAQGEAVKELQARLQSLGYYSGEIDGQFGPGTRDAVTLFQQWNGLEADGVVGSETSARLYSADARPMTATAPPSAAPAWSSADMPLLVNRTNYLPEGYQPSELVNMADYCDSQVVRIKTADIRGERVAVDALMTMLRAAQAQGIEVWQVSEGYRTLEDQQKLFDDQVAVYIRDNGLSRTDAESATRKTVADPGTSEHHLGLAFDITVPGVSFKGTEQAAWLAANCWDYGFILRYTEEKESVTGFLAEPWHIRYVGVEHAAVMRDENLCLEEYLQRCGV